MTNDLPPVVVTGTAGFIGYHVAKALLQQGRRVVGVDVLTEYGGRQIKQDRHRSLRAAANDDALDIHEIDLADAQAVRQVFADVHGPEIIHLAAQAGVRYSITNPQAYVQSNLVGFANILEAARHAQARHLTYASSSSVYGANTKLPYSTCDRVDHPVSLYAATKKSNELMAHAYAHLYRLPVTGLRFFTVYGPWGRTDMAPHLFTSAILAGRAIKVFNNGNCQRDFTYVDDIVKAVVAVSANPAEPAADWHSDDPTPAASDAPYRVYNIGNSTPVGLMEFIGTLEEVLDRKAQVELLPPQPGDVVATFADVSSLSRDFAFAPSTPLRQGLGTYVGWYLDYFGMP